MRWVKVWFIAVVIAGGVAAALVPLVSRPLQRELDRQVFSHLLSARQAADQMLQLHSRRWLDATAHAAADAMLAEALDQASRGGANIELLHRTALERLRSFNAEWKAYQVIAVDTRGRVIARAATPAGSPDEDKWKDDLSPSQLVALALRGWRLDDTWDMGGKLCAVAASPVIARDRYAGALLVAVDLGGELLGRVHQQLGVEAALMEQGQLVARGTSSRLAETLAASPGLLRKERRATLAEPIPVDGSAGGPDYAVVVAELPGEVSAREAVMVLASERAQFASPLSALQALRGLSPMELPWRELAPVAGAVGFALLLGLFLVGRAHDWPLSRLLGMIQGVARGETKLLDDGRLPGRFGSVARMMNAALERPTRPSPLLAVDETQRVASAAAGGGLEMAADPPPFGAPRAPASPVPQPLGAAPGRAPSYPSIPAVAPIGGGGGRAPSYPSVPAVAMDMKTVSGLGPLPTPATMSSMPSGNVASAVPGPAGWGMSADTTRTSSGPPPGMPSIGRSGGAAGLGSLDNLSDIRLPDAGGGFGGSVSAPGSGLPSSMHGMNSDAVLGVSAAAYVPPDLVPARDAATDDALEGEFHSVFQDYIDTRQRCGESVEGVTFEKFSAKLRANREQLIERYACKRVKFQVYVKDGRAALKATPIAE